MRFLLLTIMAVSFLAAQCGDSAAKTVEQQKVEADKKWDELMALHDGVMPQMGEVNRIKRTLRSMENIPATMQTEVDQMIERLDKSDEGMMSWMASFGKYSNSDLPHEELMAAYEKEMEKGKAVEETIYSSIKDGNALLAKLKGQE